MRSAMVEANVELDGSECEKGMRRHRHDGGEDEPLVARNAFHRLSQPILTAASHVPSSSEPKASDPETRANQLTSKAALEAAALSASLALPLAPYGLITIIPDILGIWRIQRQLVADIAAAYGKSHFLDADAMLKCLFKMASAQILRDVVVRGGERALIRRPSLRTMQRIAAGLGFTVTQRLIGRIIARTLPIIGTMGIAAYAYHDTRQVGQNAVELFGELSSSV
jgi:hypothetical protein